MSIGPGQPASLASSRVCRQFRCAMRRVGTISIRLREIGRGARSARGSRPPFRNPYFMGRYLFVGARGMAAAVTRKKWPPEGGKQVEIPYLPPFLALDKQFAACFDRGTHLGETHLCKVCIRLGIDSRRCIDRGAWADRCVRWSAFEARPDTQWTQARS
jgi:hypothetical protein